MLNVCLVRLSCLQCQFGILVVTLLSGWLLNMCHRRHDFQLKIHHKAFGGRARLHPDGGAPSANTDPLAGFRDGPRRKRDVGREEREGSVGYEGGKQGTPTCKRIAVRHWNHVQTTTITHLDVQTNCIKHRTILLLLLLLLLYKILHKV